MIKKIFSYLLWDDLCRVSVVCKRFNTAANKDSLWDSLLQYFNNRTEYIRKFSDLAKLSATEMAQTAPGTSEEKSAKSGLFKKKDNGSQVKVKRSNTGPSGAPASEADSIKKEGELQKSHEDTNNKTKTLGKQRTIDAIFHERKVLGVNGNNTTTTHYNTPHNNTIHHTTCQTSSHTNSLT